MPVERCFVNIRFDELSRFRNELAHSKLRNITRFSGPSFHARHGIQSGPLDTGSRRYDVLAVSRGE
ncbi:protein of unknown function [Candidatus Methylomirabilis oxygeniifera]|uniref:Uncharacterized protein n=1 Tax=Methylomirabilis oxygeniifera TaxID=671143 RepID=D5MKT4_METO1|nr:protein of unknown function [Candidatus Methylomirabilis oxyfera]